MIAKGLPASPGAATGKVVFTAEEAEAGRERGRAGRPTIAGQRFGDAQRIGRRHSPIARSMIGKEAGDEAEVQAPGGIKRYEIVDVRYV